MSKKAEIASVLVSFAIFIVWYIAADTFGGQDCSYADCPYINYGYFEIAALKVEEQ